MAVSIKRRIPAIMAAVAAAIALTLPGSPASAQAGGPGAQATPVVGVSGTANCPTAVPAAQVTYAGPAGPFTIAQSAGSCTSFSANTQGSFTVGGAGGGAFSSSCQAGGLQSGSSVTVPTGTIVNGVAVAQPTVVTTPNAAVVFPGGVAATLNVRSATATTVTQTAIVAGNTRIGRVICGQANVYPLNVETAAAAPELPAPISSPGGDDGPSIGMVVAAVVALALAAQLAVGVRMRRRKGDATA